jgi:hypothetical protein
VSDSNPQQLELFANLKSSATRGSPSSPASTAPSTRSSETSRPSEPDATSTTSTARARVRSTLGLAPPGPGPADTSSDAATGTAGSAAPPTQLKLIGRSNTPDETLAIPRPQTRAECELEERRPGTPCPWVGCRHHLLLEVTTAKPVQGRDARATALRLNAPARKRTGRRPGLRSSAAENQVRVWLDDAIELLFTLPYTCELDVVRDYPDGIPASSVGLVLNTSRQNIDQELAKPHVKSALRAIKRIADNDEFVGIPVSERLCRQLDAVDARIGEVRADELVERDLIRLMDTWESGLV